VDSERAEQSIEIFENPLSGVVNLLVEVEHVVLLRSSGTL
jgi:hypothetical protein